MNITAFTKEMIPDARALVHSNYLEECGHVQALPGDILPPALEDLAGSGLSVAAVEDGRLLGFLGAYGPWKPVFHTRDTAGVFSPLHAHGVQQENRFRIWQRLYQAAAERWVEAGAASHAITLHVHDAVAKEALYLYGFGVRCMDLIRPVEEMEAASGWQCRELPATQHSRLAPLRRALTEHLGDSPCFMKHDPAWVEEWIARKEQEGPRVFVAEKNGQVVAFMEVDSEGENYAVCTPGTLNICGAYALPEYRGCGAAQALLAYMLHTFKAEGVLRLGVDCESINPTALGFWSKHFQAYTHSVVRRVDEWAVR